MATLRLSSPAAAAGGGGAAAVASTSMFMQVGSIGAAAAACECVQQQRQRDRLQGSSLSMLLPVRAAVMSAAAGLDAKHLGWLQRKTSIDGMSCSGRSKTRRFHNISKVCCGFVSFFSFRGAGMHGGLFFFFLEFRLLATIVEVDSFKRLQCMLSHGFRRSFLFYSLEQPVL